MSKYQDIKDKAYHIKMPGIFYAFDDKQFNEGLLREGYIKEGETYQDLKDKGIKLTTDGLGGYGTKEAFEQRNKQYEEIDEEIKENCTPEEIFEYEYHNHECGYTGDWSEALEITNEYFPDFKPTRKLLNKLYAQYESANY